MRGIAVLRKLFAALVSGAALNPADLDSTVDQWVSNAQNYVISSPFLAIFPGLLILVTVLCVNLLGDGLRDALDPQMRKG